MFVCEEGFLSSLVSLARGCPSSGNLVAQDRNLIQNASGLMSSSLLKAVMQTRTMNTRKARHKSKAKKQDKHLEV